MFAYCGNNPVSRSDASGYFWDIFFDVVSFGLSIVDVAKHPKDRFAWAGLAGDFVDMLVPFAGGVGETIDVINGARRTIKTVDDARSIRKATKQALDKIHEAAQALGKGDNSVYVSYTDDVLEYVGITNDFNRRKNEWKGIRNIQEIVTDLDRNSARIVEQTIIDTFGMAKNGGILNNKINSIGKSNSLYKDYVEYINRVLG